MPGDRSGRPGSGRDFWSEADEAASRSWRRGPRDRAEPADFPGPRGATALRERYRDATDWRRRPGDGPERPRGLAGLLARVRHPRGGGSGGWDDGGGGRPHRKGDWWRRWTWKKVLAVLGAGFGSLVLLGSVIIGIAYANTKIPSMRQLVNQSSIASTVYFSNGKPVASFGQTTHVVLNGNQIPQIMREAMVAAEDKNFYHEGGVSISGIIRAALSDLTSSGGNLQGASTITEQLVKQGYEGLSTQATNSSTLSSGLANKIKEILIAEKLAREKSKSWILTEYLNTVYFGAGATGVGAASEAYFGIPASKMNVAQAAMLASMVQLPGYYSPIPSAGAPYKALVWRWRYHTLATMVQMGDLSAQAAAKLKFPTIVHNTNANWGGYRGYIMQRVLYELQNYWHLNTPQQAMARATTAGLKIYTSYNERLMNALYATVAQNQKLMRECAPPAVALVGGGDPGNYGFACSRLPKWVDTGAVLIQPSTGDILAEYGGQNYNQHPFDYAMESYNQVGSSFKPYVLATALKQGMNAMTSIMNGFSPLWIPPVGSGPTVYPKYQGPGGGTSPGPGWFQVINDDTPASVGPVSVQKAMAASLNTAYTSLYSRVGGAAVMQTAQQFGVYTGAGTALASNENGVGEALGQGSLTVLEQATMVATIADNGLYHASHAIVKIVAGSHVIRPPVATHTVLTAPQAAEMDWAMSQDLYPGGTAPGDNLPNGQVAIAKSGTTNLAQSAFFLGATPDYAMAVGMFVAHPGCPPRLQAQCDAKTSLQYAPPAGIQTLFRVGGLAGYGGGWPATIWHDYFTSQFSNEPVTAWPTPPTNLGTTWNLVGKLPKKHRHHRPSPSPSPTPGCPSPGNPHCSPSPPPSPTPSTCPPLPIPCSPSPTNTSPGGGPGQSGTATSVAGTAVAGTVLFGGIAVVALPSRRRRRPGRRG
jgi:membrane peptidoglycan carboxypeptidase